MGQSIEIDIPRGGKLTIEAVGFSGPACEAATKAIEDALGVVADRQKKPEYFEQATQTQNTQQRA